MKDWLPVPVEAASKAEVVVGRERSGVLSRMVPVKVSTFWRVSRLATVREVDVVEVLDDVVVVEVLVLVLVLVLVVLVLVLVVVGTTLGVVVDVVVGGGATEVVGVVGVGSEVVVGDVVGVGERGGSPGPAVFVLWVDAAVPVGVEPVPFPPSPFPRPNMSGVLFWSLCGSGFRLSAISRWWASMSILRRAALCLALTIAKSKVSAAMDLNDFMMNVYMYSGCFGFLKGKYSR
jgi:hypothetical protein